MPQIFCFTSTNSVFGVIAGNVIEFLSVLSEIDNKRVSFSTNTDFSADVLTFSVTECGKFVVLAFTDNHVRCYNVDTLEMVGSILLKKRAVTIICSEYCRSENTECISLLTDKSGDLYALDLPFLKKQIFLGGHTTSIITDICRVGRFLATADRDEKIRIANYPDVFVIESHCLGHTSVISSLSVVVISGDICLVSTGWDHKLIIWQPSEGRQLAVHSFSEDIPSVELEMEESSDPTAKATMEEEENIDKTDQNAPEDQESDKDEGAAGEYPFKAICGRNSSFICVIFRNSSRLEVLKVSKARNSGTGNDNSADDSSLENELKIIKVFQCELPAVPCDIVLSGNDEVLLLALPTPHLLVCFDVINTEGAFELTRRTSIQCPQIDAFNEKYQGINFLQQGAGTDSGMLKHSLDRPFNREKDINKSSRKGAKRSRKF
eukprot:gene32882-42559_t